MFSLPLIRSPRQLLTLRERDRIGFSLVVAALVHLVLLAGLSFDPEVRRQASQTLEVTLAQFRSDTAPEQADFLAPQNQLGSGEQEAALLPTTRETALFEANEIRELAAQQRPAPPAPQLQADPPQRVEAPAPSPAPDTTHQPSPDTAKVHTRDPRAERRTTVQTRQEASRSQPTAGQATSLLERSLEIASLQAKLDWQTQNQARQPRVRRLYSASTRSAADAAYLETWRRKIERIGNLNYPAEARQRGLYGSLRLLVALNADGTIRNIEVLHSSGHAALDNAAIRIVRLAAPFAPFPDAIRQKTDVLEIIRTWKFERNQRLYSG